MSGAAVTAPGGPRPAAPGALGGPVLSGGEGLRMPDEPAGLRDDLRDALHGGGGPVPVSAGEARLGNWLWERWSSSLEPVGIDREAVVDQVAGCRWELRLWLAGERTWSHYVSGLAGRISRRLPDRGTASAPVTG